MRWPWKKHESDMAQSDDVNAAAVAYVQAGVQSAVNDLNRSLVLMERTFKSIASQPITRS